MSYETIVTVGLASMFGMFGFFVFPFWQLGLGIGILTGAALGVVLTKQFRRLQELETRVNRLEEGEGRES